jgi:hypothetical protein
MVLSGSGAKIPLLALSITTSPPPSSPTHCWCIKRLLCSDISLVTSYSTDTQTFDSTDTQTHRQTQTHRHLTRNKLPDRHPSLTKPRRNHLGTDAFGGGDRRHLSLKSFIRYFHGVASFVAECLALFSQFFLAPFWLGFRLFSTFRSDAPRRHI